jgi:hypothetical protein
VGSRLKEFYAEENVEFVQATSVCLGFPGPAYLVFGNPAENSNISR